MVKGVWSIRSGRFFCLKLGAEGESMHGVRIGK